MSKLKRNMIELGGFQACDVVTHKKLFKVNAFVSGENLPVANQLIQPKHVN